MINYGAKVVHQGIDFLTIDYYFQDLLTYNLKFDVFLNKLDLLKEQAKNKDGFGAKFVKNELVGGLGYWFISSRGNGRFKYYFENNDFRVFVSTAKINTDIAQVRVEIPAKTIFRIGVKNAILLFETFLKKIYCDKYIRKVNRIDLATDVWGVLYDLDDIYKFQTRMGQVNFFDVDNKNFNGCYMRFNFIQGIQFGKGAKLFRIYDKTKKINISPNEAYIKEKWKFNGYDETKGYPVFRHEIQYRRDELKKFIPYICKDEVDYILNHLGNLWAKALTYVEYVPLNDKELKRVKVPLIKADTKRKILYRAKKDVNRFNLWNEIRYWDNKEFQPVDIFRRVKYFSLDYLKKQFKGFISAYYKVFGGDLSKFKEVIEYTQNELYKNEGIDLHTYGLAKLASSFVENYETIIRNGEFIPNTQYQNILSSYNELIEILKSINNPKYKNSIKKAVNYV